MRRRFLTRPLRFLSATICGLFAAPAAAQGTMETRIAATVGLTMVDFREFGGAFAAAAFQLRMRRSLSPALEAELEVFSVHPAGGAAAQPDCVPGAVCQSWSTPATLAGVLISAIRPLGTTGLRASLGVGAVRAFGGEGLRARSSLAGAAGIDWSVRRSSRFKPVLELRLVPLAKPIGGARWLWATGVGVEF